MKRPVVVLLLLALSAPLIVVAKGVDVAGRSITVPLYQEPRTLNSMSSPTVEFTAEVLAHVQEGLMRLDQRRRLAAGVAESWEVTPGELRFRLRADARWQNGERVTAHDFVFAWRMLVTPENGSQSANLASPIKHATAILKGEMPATRLGVRAVSDDELVVDLAHPCNWCLKLMTTAAFYPVNEAFYRSLDADDYATSPTTHLANGPFTLADWQRGKTLLLQRNTAYWRRADVYLERVHYGYIANDNQSQLNLYRSGELALARVDRGTQNDAMQLGQRIHTSPSGYVFHLQFSHVDGMSSANENLRKAVALVVDKQDVVNRVIASPGTRVADSLFHDWMAVGERSIRQTLAIKPATADLALARAYLAKASKELGISGRPQLVLTIFDNDTNLRVAEYLQNRLQLIGVELKIDPQIVTILLDKFFKGQSDMTLIGWVVDVDDPIDQISFLGNPVTRGVLKGVYPGQDMIDIYFAYRDASDPLRRLSALQAAHDLFTDRVTVFPMYETYTASLIDPRLKGYVFQPVRAFNDYRYVVLQD